MEEITYFHEMKRHLFPHFIILVVLPQAIGQRGDSGDDGGRWVRKMEVESKSQGVVGR